MSCDSSRSNLRRVLNLEHSFLTSRAGCLLPKLNLHVQVPAIGAEGAALATVTAQDSQTTKPCSETAVQ